VFPPTGAKEVTMTVLCDHCKTDEYLVQDIGGGCEVCTECGLVAIDYIISDEAVFDKAINTMSNSMTTELDTMFSLPTAKIHDTSNITFFVTQDQHKLKLMKFNSKFNELFEQLQLHESIRIDAKYMYLEFEKNHSFKGQNIEIVICAFIYMSAKKNNYAVNVKMLFDSDFETDIMNTVNVIEEKLNIVKKIVIEDFHDKDIESFICKFSKLINLSRKMTRDVIKMIPQAEFIMRKKEIIAVALIIKYKNNNKLIKVFSKEFCISDLAIKSALRELNNVK
jgi:transcription initiation factor TFIIIB Brf1 subunit/transcription initiation factor TFIIB